MTEEMSCRELVELVTEYLEGRLSAVDRRRFEEHMAGCPGCQTYLEQMRASLRLLGGLSEETLPPSMRDELLRAFRSWKRSL
jgi:anti-sigma factor RsiW